MKKDPERASRIRTHVFGVATIVGVILINLYSHGKWPKTTWLGLVSYFVLIVSVGLTLITIIVLSVIAQRKPRQ